MQIVAVVGGSEVNDPNAEPLGAWLAGQQAHLLTGGGPGVMESVCKGFASASNRQGCSIGIIPVDKNGKIKNGYPNPWVQIPIYTHLHGQLNANGSGGGAPEGMFSRNHINARSAHVMIALSGGPGTLAEIRLALNRKKPVLALLTNGGCIANMNAAAVQAHFGNQLQMFSDLRSLQAALRAFL